MKIEKQIFNLGLGAALLLVTSACGNSSNQEKVSTEKTVSVLGVVVGEQQDKLEAALAPFEAVSYTHLTLPTKRIV